MFSLCCLHTLPSLHPKYAHLHRDNTQSDFPAFHWILTWPLASREHRGWPRPCQRSGRHRPPLLPPCLPPQPATGAAPLHAQLLCFSRNSAICVCFLCFLSLEKVTPSGKKGHNQHMNNPNVPKWLTHWDPVWIQIPPKLGRKRAQETYYMLSFLIMKRIRETEQHNKIWY